MPSQVATLNFDKPVNTSLQIGDIVYYSTINANGNFSVVVPGNTTELGTVVFIEPDGKSIKVIHDILTSLPSDNDYIAFAKDPSETPTATDFYKGVSYTGNDYSLSVGDVGFTPAITWIKSYDGGRDHSIFDKPRQSEQRQNSAVDQQEYFQSGGGYLQAWGGDGFNVVTGSSNSYNVVENAINYVAWNFKGTTDPTNNSAGNLLGVNCSNQAAGVSCVRYIGKEQVGDTLGHNLGGTPEIAIIKQCDGTREWTVPFLNEASGTYGVLSNTNAKATETNRWSAVDSTTLTVNSDPYTNGVNSDYLAYFFRSVATS